MVCAFPYETYKSYTIGQGVFLTTMLVASFISVFGLAIYTKMWQWAWTWFSTCCGAFGTEHNTHSSKRTRGQNAPVPRTEDSKETTVEKTDSSPKDNKEGIDENVERFYHELFMSMFRWMIYTMFFTLCFAVLNFEDLLMYIQSCDDGKDNSWDHINSDQMVLFMGLIVHVYYLPTAIAYASNYRFKKCSFCNLCRVFFLLLCIGSGVLSFVTIFMVWDNPSSVLSSAVNYHVTFSLFGICLLGPLIFGNIRRAVRYYNTSADINATLANYNAAMGEEAASLTQNAMKDVWSIPIEKTVVIVSQVCVVIIQIGVLATAAVGWQLASHYHYSSDKYLVDSMSMRGYNLIVWSALVSIGSQSVSYISHWTSAVLRAGAFRESVKGEKSQAIMEQSIRVPRDSATTPFIML